MRNYGPKWYALDSSSKQRVIYHFVFSFDFEIFIGCGKTSLLDVLAKRVNSSPQNRSLTGTVKIRPDAKMRYVQQEEALVGVLTTRETLVFAARLAGAPLSRTVDLIDEMGEIS